MYIITIHNLTFPIAGHRPPFVCAIQLDPVLVLSIYNPRVSIYLSLLIYIMKIPCVYRTFCISATRLPRHQDHQDKILRFSCSNKNFLTIKAGTGETQRGDVKCKRRALQISVWTPKLYANLAFIPNRLRTSFILVSQVNRHQIILLPVIFYEICFLRHTIHPLSILFKSCEVASFAFSLAW